MSMSVPISIPTESSSFDADSQSEDKEGVDSSPNTPPFHAGDINIEGSVKVGDRGRANYERGEEVECTGVGVEKVLVGAAGMCIESETECVRGY